MKKGWQLVSRKFGLLVFILVFIGGFKGIFGPTSLYVGVFVLTGLLMFKEMPLGVSLKRQWLLVPAFYGLVTVVPYWLTLVLPEFVKLFLVASTVLIILLVLVRTLQYQSYIPFLMLFALNQQDRTPIGPRLVAALVGGLVVVLVAVLYRKERAKNWPDSLEKAAFKPSLQQNQSLIIKLTAGILCAYLVGQWLGAVKVGWIMLTVISLTQPDLALTRQKSGQRLTATVIGLLIFTLLFLVLVPKTYFATLLIGISYAYMFVKTYFVKMIFNTVNALNAAVFSLSLTPNVMLVERLLFVLFGVVVVYLIGFAYRYFERNLTHQTA